MIQKFGKDQEPKIVNPFKAEAEKKKGFNNLENNKSLGQKIIVSKTNIKNQEVEILIS